MVRAGWAVSHHTGMHGWEMFAREGRRGVWRGPFVRPEDWRKGDRLPGEPGETTAQREALAALDSGQVAAAGLDVTDPEPLPKGHPLWSRNVVITPHSAGQSPGGERRRHQIFRENLRRFGAGEMLLNVVDTKVGY